MNHIRMHQCDDIKCLSQQKMTFTKEIYQVDAMKLCRLINQNEKKTFSQLLCQASNPKNILSLSMIPDLISVAIHWNSSILTTSHIEDLISIIDPFICLHELFSDVTIKTHPINQQQRTLIGLVCFYSRTIEVFFSYESRQSQWYFCLDGNLTRMKNWFDVQRKCLEFHLQPFLLIYANANEIFIDRTQLLQRTVVQLKTCSSTNKSVSMFQQEQNEQTILSKISSFATLNSSMLFLPKMTTTTTTSYINQETVAKVMQQQQQLLKKDELYTNTSSKIHYRQKSDENLSSEDSSTSSQRDSGFLSNDIQSNDTSPRDSLVEIDSTTTNIDQHSDFSLASIEYYLTESLKHESASNYTLAIESCQRALIIIDKIYELTSKSNTNLSIYVRTRKNSLLLRMRSLKKRQNQYEPSNEITFEYVDNLPKKNENRRASILLSTTRLLRPKKNVKFSDSIALIVPINDEISEQPSEHLIHSFLRNIQQSTLDSDLDTTSISSDDLPIGLIECSLCHKRFSKTNQIGTYCTNCHFYMQRFQPISSSSNLVDI